MILLIVHIYHEAEIETDVDETVLRRSSDNIHNFVNAEMFENSKCESISNFDRFEVGKAVNEETDDKGDAGKPNLSRFRTLFMKLVQVLVLQVTLPLATL